MCGWIEFVIFLLLALPVTFFDIKEQRIPDMLTLGGIALFIVVKLVLKMESFGILCAECFLGFGFFWLIRVLTHGRLGLGDAKYSALIAVSVGFSAWFAALFIASVAGLLCVALLVGLLRIDRKSRIPFAPFLTFGASLAYLFRDYYSFIPTIGL